MNIQWFLDQLSGQNDTQFHFSCLDHPFQDDPDRKSRNAPPVQSSCVDIVQWESNDEFQLKPLPSDITYWDEDCSFQFAEEPRPAPTLWSNTDLELPDLFQQRQAHKVQPLCLTDPENGLLRQKVNLNLTEIAEYLINQGNFISVGDELAFYQIPDWEILSQKSSAALIMKALHRADKRIAGYLNDRLLAEIRCNLLNSPHIRHVEFIPPADPHLLCCRDGFYRWPEGICLPADREELRFSKLDVDAQEIGPQDTPHFDQFLYNVTQGDTALEQLIWEVFGIIITGYPVKKFFLFQGVRDSGKSLASDLLQHILGKSSCFAVNSINQLSDRWLPGMLPGKLLCICGDVPDKPLSPNAVGILKQLTGKDAIYGERKGEDPFMFHNTAKLLFLSNFPLRIRSQQDSALLQRCIKIPFQNSVPEDRQDPNLCQRLLEEKGGIIWNALNSLQSLENRGGIFTKVESAADTILSSTLPTTQERIMAFFRAHCVLEPNASITVALLHSKFLEFDQQEYPDLAPIQSNIFSRTLNQCGLPIQDYRTASGRGYRGIRIK